MTVTVTVGSGTGRGLNVRLRVTVRVRVRNIVRCVVRVVWVAVTVVRRARLRTMIRPRAN